MSPVRACRGCGAREHPGAAAFCFRCGQPLPAGHPPGGAPAAMDGALAYTPPHLEAVLSEPGVGGGERKDVAILFADVAGSLAMAAALDPEDVHAVMNGFFAIANEAVHAESGSINQYRGDGFMALFGAPRALPDNAVRACRAAIAIRRATERYAESVRARFGQPFVLRMGINAGLVWVGSIGTGLREDYTAEGPTVGVAARVEELAPPGQILATAEVRDRTRAAFAWADLGPRRLRGIDEPMAVFELLREVPRQPGLASDWRHGALPWVERPELETLAEHLSRSPGPGARTPAVEVVGEAGIGKTRLVAEALARALPGHDVLLLRGRESGRQRAFELFREALASWPVDRAGRDLAGQALEAVDGNGSIGPGPQERLVQLIDHQLTRRPLALFVDDANWVDPSSERLLAQLAAETAGRELRIVATRRDVSEPPAFLLYAERIALAPLERAQGEALARSILGDGPGVQDLVGLSAVRAGGNPLFTEELARSLREGSAGLRRVARLELALERADLEVPRNLRGVVAARIDALPVALKRVLEAAAVLGQPFDEALLAELGVETRGALGDLAERGLFVATKEAGHFDFQHGVVREVAYEQLVRRRRRELHARAARALERREGHAPAAHAALVGSHFDAAGESASAARHLLRAGRRFARMDAHAEAAVHLRRGIELLVELPDTRPGDRGAAAIVLASCLNALDRGAEAGAVLESIEDGTIPERDQRLLARTLIQAGWVRFTQGGEVDAARRMVERGMAAAERLPGTARELGLAHNYLCRIAILEGDTRRALEQTRRAVEQASGRGDELAECVALYNRVHACTDAGELEVAVEAAAACRNVAARRDLELLRASAIVSDARVAYFTGDFEQALHQGERGRRAGEEAGQVGLAYAALMISGYALLGRGSPREAREHFDELARFEQPWPTTELHRARGLLECGLFDGAVELAGACLDARPTPLVRARALAVRGLALGLGSAVDIDEAERALADAVSICDRLHLRPYRAEAHELMAELWAARGDERRAGYYRSRAEAGYLECGMSAFATRLAAGGAALRSSA